VNNRASVYKCRVDDARATPPLADDPNFLERLAELDRGLASSSGLPDPARHPPGRAPAARPAATDPPPFAKRPPAAPSHTPLPASITAPFDALTEPEARFDRGLSRAVERVSSRPVEPGARRPLVDLFPPLTDREGESAAARDTLRSDSPNPVNREAGPTAGGLTAEAFYGLDEEPFSLTTDPRFFFHSTPHDAVSQRLLTAIRKHEGLFVLIGETGAGKTTLCRTVVEQLDRRTLTSFVTDPFVSGEELLKTVLADFGVMSRDELARGPFATRHELSTTLLSFVETLAPLEASAVIIIDEAQNLPPDVIEQVRILADAADASSLLQIVLVGQPSLAALLRRPEQKALHQRVTVRATLDPLPPDEIGRYLSHRLGVAGARPRVTFDEPALERVFRLSRGVPRVINLLCERALARGHEASAGVIDAAIVEAAAEDLDLGEAGSAARAVATRAALIVALAVCVLLGAGVAAWVFHDAVSRAVAAWRQPPAR
jgi:type II secretory pathway predicted ATPase ExeA